MIKRTTDSRESRRRANQAFAARSKQAGVRTVRIPADVIAGMDKFARLIDITRTEAITLALREWLSEQNKKKFNNL